METWEDWLIKIGAIMWTISLFKRAHSSLKHEFSLFLTKALISMHLELLVVLYVVLCGHIIVVSYGLVWSYLCGGVRFVILSVIMYVCK